MIDLSSRDKGAREGNDQLTTVAGVTMTCGAFALSFFCRGFRAKLCSLFNLCDFQRVGALLLLLLLLLPPSPPPPPPPLLLIGTVGLVGPCFCMWSSLTVGGDAVAVAIAVSVAVSLARVSSSRCAGDGVDEAALPPSLRLPRGEWLKNPRIRCRVELCRLDLSCPCSIRGSSDDGVFHVGVPLS